MQDDLNAVRATGTTNVVMVGAEQFANDASDWLANVPTDPAGQLAMSFHVYDFNAICVTASCWSGELLPIAAKYPIISGEIGESDAPASSTHAWRGRTPMASPTWLEPGIPGAAGTLRS